MPSAELRCGINEVAVDCPRDCSYDSCPKSRYHDKTPCPRPEKCRPPTCKCIFNYRRADNGTCIPTTECPPFECEGVREVYDSCPPWFPSQKCEDAAPTDVYPFFILTVVECSPACRCQPHHWRDHGTCVPYYECPNIKAKLRGKPSTIPES
nr:inducible metalloproteinase inhibitor protein-like [Danaus plexippus plexippus]